MTRPAFHIHFNGDDGKLIVSSESGAGFTVTSVGYSSILTLPLTPEQALELRDMLTDRYAQEAA